MTLRPPPAAFSTHVLRRSVVPTRVGVFLFSAVTWNPHRIHYDETFARTVEGYRGLVVPGPLIAAWLLELATEWVAGWGEVAQINVRNESVAWVDEAITFEGVVQPGSRTVAEVTARAPDERIVCRATVTATTPSGGHQGVSARSTFGSAPRRHDQPAPPDEQD